MKKGLQGLTAATLFVPVLAAAESLSYNYIEAGLALYPSYESQDFFGVDLGASYGLTKNVFAFGGLKYLSDDIDATAFHVGGAYRHYLNEKTDIWGGVTVEHQEFDGNGWGSVDDTALGLRGGLRHQVDRQLEVGGSARIITGDLDYVGLTGTARYAIQQDMKLYAEIDLYDGELGLIGGLSFDF